MKVYSQNHSGLKMFCCFILLILFCFCFMGMSRGVKADDIAYCLEIPRNDFPVRSEASDQSDVLISLPQGAVLFPESQTRGWYRVPFSDGIYGYVLQGYVTEVTVPAGISTFPGEALMDSPSETANTLGIYSRNTEVTISKRNGEWCLVTPYGSSAGGYIKESSLLVGDKIIYNTTSNQESSTPLAVIASSVNMRSNAGTVYDIVEKVSYGTRVTVLGSKTGTDGYTWYYVRLSSGSVGYIRSDLVGPLAVGTGLSGRTIVIDPGHGSRKSSTAALDVGAVGPNGIREKDINLKIALYLKDYLEADGARVIMTRTTDVGVMTLTDRANVANNNNADMFISIHCNSSDNQSANGTETYYSTVDQYKNTISSQLISQRSALATPVQSNLISQLSLRNRGVKTSNFTVITKTTMPSILIETAFISNPSEERMLNSASVQDSAAKGCYLGIREFFS